MYFGSVRFFKHVILMALLMILVAPSIAAGSFYTKLQRLEQEFHGSGSVDENSSDIILSYGHLIQNDDLEYKKMYPNLYVKQQKPFKDPEEKVLYLTFDDGPSAVTEKVLDRLKEMDVKATFFVVYKEGTDAELILKRIVEEGHGIGVHSGSHQYENIYFSVESFLDDFNLVSQWIEDVTGVKPDIFRFPGGSLSPHNQRISTPLIAEMMRRGYVYYDWNISAEDASNKVSTRSIVNSIHRGIADKKRGFILAHDGPQNHYIIDALPEVIQNAEEMGYRFKKIESTIQPIQFKNYYQ